MSLFLDKPALLDWPINPFDWDKDFYKFMRDEKDMHPYSVIKNKDGSITIVHNVLGLDKKDLKLSTKTIGGKVFIVIEGKTEDEITKKIYSVNSKFSCDIDACDLDNIKSTMKNGLLYITIATKEAKEPEEKFIEII